MERTLISKHSSHRPPRTATTKDTAYHSAYTASSSGFKSGGGGAAAFLKKQDHASLSYADEDTPSSEFIGERSVTKTVSKLVKQTAGGPNTVNGGSQAGMRAVRTSAIKMAKRDKKKSKQNTPVAQPDSSSSEEDSTASDSSSSSEAETEPERVVITSKKKRKNERVAVEKTSSKRRTEKSTGPRAPKPRSSTDLLGSNYVYYMGKVGAGFMSDMISWKHLIIAYNFNTIEITDFTAIPTDSINNVSKCKTFIIAHLVNSGHGELCDAFRNNKLLFVDGGLDYSGPVPFNAIKERQLIEVIHSESASILSTSSVSGCLPESITEWLKGIGLDEYVDTFSKEGLNNVATIIKLTDQDIKDLGIKIGHRSKLNEEINRLKLIRSKSEEAASASSSEVINSIIKIDHTREDISQARLELEKMREDLKSMMGMVKESQAVSSRSPPAVPTAASADRRAPETAEDPQPADTPAQRNVF